MQLLILGATGLSGTAITLEALARGHEVVAVHRGGSDTLRESDAPGLVDYVHDRADGHRGLAARGPFDAIVDVCARVPAWVADAVRTLDGGDPWWVQLSSVSAYADQARRGPVEADALAAFEDPELELRMCTDPRAPLPDAAYGAAKAACERLLLERSARWQRATVLRPVLLTGAHDDTWRVPWWPARMVRGGSMVAPPAEDPVQVLDVRDLAWIVLEAVERRVAGVYNAAPPPFSQSVGSMLDACRAALEAAGMQAADVVHLSAQALQAHGVEPWSDLPAWVPPDGEFAGMVTARTDALQEAFDLEPRPLRETMDWLVEWAVAGGRAASVAGIDADLEARVLAAC